MGQLRNRQKCHGLVSGDERATGKRFDWVLYARPDLLWYRPLLPWCLWGGLPWSPLWLKAVDGVSFELHAGESLGVVGASGCGKSTLCRALMGLTPIRGGRVQLLGKDLLRLRGREARQARRTIQMVFQDPLACLNPALQVADAIADPLLIHGLCSKATAREEARHLLELSLIHI